MGHNVPIVDGLAPVSEAIANGGLWWPRPYAEAQLLIEMCGNGIELMHDGYQRATRVKNHCRRIVPAENGLAVTDSFLGHGTANVAFCWHFGRGFDRFDSLSMTARGADGEVRLSFDGVPTAPEVLFLSGEAPGGWFSTSYGEADPTVAISLSWRLELPAEVTTRFALMACAE